MKNNIKTAPVKFREDGLYYAVFCLCPKLVIIIIFNVTSNLEDTLGKSASVDTMSILL